MKNNNRKVVSIYVDEKLRQKAEKEIASLNFKNYSLKKKLNLSSYICMILEKELSDDEETIEMPRIKNGGFTGMGNTF